MNREDMMLAFRMIAMGRHAVPQVEALVDYLLGLVPVVPVAEASPAVLEIELPGADASKPAAGLSQVMSGAVAEGDFLASVTAPKRGRKPKAD